MINSVSDNIQTAQLRVLVVGASGGTGRWIVSQALARGYEVTALVRSPEKGRALVGAKLVIGDARDEAALRKALKGQDAVVSALGTPASPFREVTLLSSATRALVNAMKAEHVTRLVCITGIGAGDSRGHGGFLFDRLIFPLLLRNVYADKDRQEAIVRDSGLDWVLVRPSVLNDKPSHGPIRALTDLSNFHGGTVSREDVASFVLQRRSVGLSLDRAVDLPRSRGPRTTHSGAYVEDENIASGAKTKRDYEAARWSRTERCVARFSTCGWSCKRVRQ